MNQMMFLKFLQKCLQIVYLGFFFSLFFGIRAVSSTSVGGLLFFTIVFAIIDKTVPARNRNFFVIGCLFFYLLQLLALTYTGNLSVGLQHIQIKITLFIIPVSLYYSNYLNTTFRDQIMPFYILFLALAMLFCLGTAAYKYALDHDDSVFFYHSLVRPFDHHAVLFSILAFIGFVYLLERFRRQTYILNKPLHFFIGALFILFIILLASKIVIIFSFASILIYTGISIKNSRSGKMKLFVSALASLSILIAILVTKNPVSTRFNDIFIGNIKVIEKNQFSPGDYFNGLQFRLLQWKLVAEILHEQHAWIFGVSPGDAQNLLDQKYLSLNMYVGDHSEEHHGFLRYNTHNEFLESILQTGIIGLFAFLVVCWGLLHMMILSKKLEFWLIGTLLLCYSLVESVFETQFGVLIFTFFPLFLFYTTVKDSDKKTVTQWS